jgi:hypothetical protein
MDITKGRDRHRQARYRRSPNLNIYRNKYVRIADHILHLSESMLAVLPSHNLHKNLHHLATTMETDLL